MFRPKIALFCATLFVAIMAKQVQATPITLTYEDIIPGSDSYISNGFLHTTDSSTGGIFRAEFPDSGYGISLQNVADTIRIRSVDPDMKFGVQSFDLTGRFPFFMPDFPVNIAIQGFKEGVISVGFYYSDPSTTNLIQTTYTMNPVFWESGLEELRITTFESGFTAAAAIDNLVLLVDEDSPAPVSAPTTLGLVGLGLVVMARRKKQRANT